MLCYLVSYLGREELAHGIIKSYLSAVKYLHISYGFPCPFDTPTPKLDLIEALRSPEESKG